MNKDQIFIGDIRKCTKYEDHIDFSSSEYLDDDCIGSVSFGHTEKDDELYKSGAVLVKMKNGGYVDLEKLHTVLDYLKVYRDITKSGYRLGGLMMSTSAHCEGCLFVDEKTLQPYYGDKKQKGNISLRELKEQVKTGKKF